MKYDAFISYRRENGFLMAQVIRDRLKEKGINCFLDLEELRSGKFDEKILLAIQEAHTFILILPQNALNRCSNENDWVRREVLEAVRCNKTIIPVMYDGFKWPKKWNENIPEEIRNLEKMNGVSGSQEYLPAMINRIISYMPQEKIGNRLITKEGKKYVASETVGFFKEMLQRVEAGVCVDMAFHAGNEWRQVSDKVKILTYILEKKIKLRVLANTSEDVYEITRSMTQRPKLFCSVMLVVFP